MADTDSTTQATQTGETQPEVTFATKDEFTEFISRKVGEALAPKLKAIETLKAEAEQAKALKAKLEEIEQAKAQQSSTAEDRWAKEREQLQRQHEALQEQIRQQQEATAAVTQRWHEKERMAYVTALASEAGAAPTAIADVAALFPRDLVQVEETEGTLSLSIVDPQTGLPQDPQEVMSSWLSSKPHLQAPQARGAGLPPGQPAKPNGQQDPTAGMTDPEALAYWMARESST